MKTATNGIENLLLQAKDTSMMCPDLYQYYNNLEQRRIVLNDEIDDSLLEMVIMPLLEMDNDGTGKPIELVIQSPGGSVWVGLVLANVIEKMKTPLTITIMGFAMSAGALIAMAHNENVKRRAYPFSVFLIHNGSISIASDKKKVKSADGLLNGPGP